MKNWSALIKILCLIAAIAGIIYVIAAYGDKIVAFARRLLGRDYNCLCDSDDYDCFDDLDDADDSAADADFEG